MKILRILLIIIGCIFSIDGAISALTANFTIGIISEILLGAVCILFGMFLKKLKAWLKISVTAVLASILISCISVWLYGIHDTADYTEDVLIVLGAGIHGEIPTAPLAARLDTAAEYLTKNKSAYAIVTGGQGPQESITEAEAMEKYLIAKGIDGNRILKEDKATSTSENFRYSKKILDERFKNAKIAVLTNDFHIYRAKRLGEIEGVSAAAIHAKTPFEGRISAYIRELLAIAKMWVIDMRK